MKSYTIIFLLVFNHLCMLFCHIINKICNVLQSEVLMYEKNQESKKNEKESGKPITSYNLSSILPRLHDYLQIFSI